MAKSRSGPGPGIPRYQLGRELAQLRAARDLGSERVAEILDCSPSKVRRIEAGSSLPSLPELERLLELYEVCEGDYRNTLIELRSQGKQRGWWSRFGRLPEPISKLLDFESRAIKIRFFEPLLVPGHLQTESHARAVLSGASSVGATEEQVEKWVEIRMARQEMLLHSDERPDLWFVIEEGVVRRPVGGPAVHREQLTSFLDGPYAQQIQVLRTAVEPHPGLNGAYWIFDFDPNTRPPVAYVECQAGQLYLDDEQDVRRLSLGYDLLRSIALSPAESRALIAEVLKEL